MKLIEQAIAMADFVLIPVRTSFFDLTAIEPVTAMCRRYRVKFAFVLVAVDKSFKPLIAQATDYLKPEGPILQTQIHHRMGYIQAVTQGRTGAEVARDLAVETDSLWAEVKAWVDAPKLKGRAHV